MLCLHSFVKIRILYFFLTYYLYIENRVHRMFSWNPFLLYFRINDWACLSWYSSITPHVLFGIWLYNFIWDSFPLSDSNWDLSLIDEVKPSFQADISFPLLIERLSQDCLSQGSITLSLFVVDKKPNHIKLTLIVICEYTYPHSIFFLPKSLPSEARWKHHLGPKVLHLSQKKDIFKLEPQSCFLPIHIQRLSLNHLFYFACYLFQPLKK